MSLSIDQIEVPEGMMEAALSRIAILPKTVELVLQSALFHLAEHPIVPSEEESEEMYQRFHHRRSFGWNDMQDCATEWQRRMFLKREPKLPEEVEAWIRKAVEMGIDETIVREAAKRAGAK